MPILGKENDIHPEDLFDRSEEYESAWLFYILSRREKEFMRQLYALKIAFFGPTIEKKYRSPNGRNICLHKNRHCIETIRFERID